MNQKMLKAIKYFNIVCGILILAGIAVVSIEMYRQVRQIKSTETVALSPVMQMDSPLLAGLGLPSLTQFHSVAMNSERIMIHAILPSKEHRIIILAVNTLKILAVIQPETPEGVDQS